jgi:hypothetical protein
MALLPLQIPAGVYRNGTDLQSAGRWRDSNLVRWLDNTLRPIKGWRARTTDSALSPIRGAIGWIDNSQNIWSAGGTYNKLFAYNAGGQQFDITPVGLTSGIVDADLNQSYGGTYYGSSLYGVTRPDTSIPVPATSWSLSTWGENLLACSDADGKIYEWDLNTSNPAVAVTNAPVDNRYVMATQERFVFALGAGGNPRMVQWSDREDNTTWTPAATNEAGSFELQTAGRIRCAKSLQGQTLILTDMDAHVATYIGPPYVYGFERVGSSCGVIGKQAIAVCDAGAFWMGREGFYIYRGGSVAELNSDVSDYVYSSMNGSQRTKCFGMTNSKFGEVWFFYPQGNEVDSYVIYNYVEDTWSIGSLDRTAGFDGGSYRNPTMFSTSDYLMYEHEIGFRYGDLMPFAETGPISLGVGDDVMVVTEMIPDERTQGDVQAVFKTRFYPNDTEREYGAYVMSNPTSLRFTGRQIRMRVEGATASDWRLGINRLDVKAGGRR